MRRPGLGWAGGSSHCRLPAAVIGGETGLPICSHSPRTNSILLQSPGQLRDWRRGGVPESLLSNWSFLFFHFIISWYFLKERGQRREPVQAAPHPSPSFGAGTQLHASALVPSAGRQLHSPGFKFRLLTTGGLRQVAGAPCALIS